LARLEPLFNAPEDELDTTLDAWIHEFEQSPQYSRPVQENPFKNISRNQTIKVTYPDGIIREGKFKRLEEESRAGKCSLVS
jgi:hypothetical protein